MIAFAIIANALLIASLYFPASGSLQLRLFAYAAPFVLYLVFAVKSAHTEPESAFKVQRFIILLSELISIYIAFEPTFSRRHVPASFTEHAISVSAMIGATLLVRWRYYEQD